MIIYNEDTVRRVLKLSSIAYDDETIHFIIEEILIQKEIVVDFQFSLNASDVYSFILHRHPLWVIYYEAYIHDYINPIITYLVVEKIKHKAIECTKRQIQEICFYAQKLFNEEKAESFSHAVNSAVKVFTEKEWSTPYGFLDVFTEYLYKID